MKIFTSKGMGIYALLNASIAAGSAIFINTFYANGDYYGSGAWVGALAGYVLVSGLIGFVFRAIDGSWKSRQSLNARYLILWAGSTFVGAGAFFGLMAITNPYFIPRTLGFVLLAALVIAVVVLGYLRMRRADATSKFEHKKEDLFV